jgi:hypothetical protein
LAARERMRCMHSFPPSDSYGVFLPSLQS